MAACWCLLLLTLVGESASKLRHPYGSVEPEFRLPTWLRPTHYKVELDLPDPSKKPKTFHGRVTITMEVLNNTNEIWLNANNHLKITKSSLSSKKPSKDYDTNDGDFFDGAFDEDQRSVAIKYDHETGRELLQVKLKSELKAGHIAILKLEYTAPFFCNSKKQIGVYWADYGDGSWVIVTQFQGPYARCAMPCFDEPQLKATFEVSIKHPGSYTALANGKLRNVEKGKSNETATSHFETTPIMSTYVLSLAVFNKFKHVETQHKGKPIRFFANPDCVDTIKKYNDLTPKMLEYFENYFDSKFVMNKLDSIAVQMYNGGMEHWGLVTYMSKMLCSKYKPFLYLSKEMIAHEIAHQWFGNLVTMKWWNELWMNEGFSTYMATVSLAAVEKRTDKSVDKYFIKMARGSLKAHNKTALHPINTSPIGDVQYYYLDMKAKVVYQKAALVIRMLHHVVGEDVFKLAFRKYFKRFAFKNVDRYDLYWSFKQALTELNKPPFNLVEFLESWLLEPNYPVLHTKFAKHKNGTQVYMLSQRPSISTARYNWMIPIWYDVLGNQTKKKRHFVWMKPTQDHTVSITLKQGETVILNPDMRALTEVRYSKASYVQLQEELRKNRKAVSSATRSEIYGDAFNLARRGELDYSSPLSLALSAKEDSNAFVVIELDNQFQKLYRSFRSDKQNCQLFSKYAAGVIGKKVCERKPTDTVNKLLRATCKLWQERATSAVGVASKPVDDEYKKHLRQYRIVSSTREPDSALGTDNEREKEEHRRTEAEEWSRKYKAGVVGWLKKNEAKF